MGAKREHFGRDQKEAAEAASKNAYTKNYAARAIGVGSGTGSGSSPGCTA